MGDTNERKKDPRVTNSQHLWDLISFSLGNSYGVVVMTRSCASRGGRM